MNQCCKNCRFFEPEINPDTGRVLTSKPGNCNYVITLPKLPDSLLSWKNRSFLYKTKMWHRMGENCVVFEPKQERKTKTAHEATQLIIYNDNLQTVNS